ncbi:hypothetical protein EU537_11625 [Candidatus Thorarchaeota archaeon]|nr:MAG: hypothetical protein EU537_11625 [Candidatus Thorarchaeota archaeon]
MNDPNVEDGHKLMDVGVCRMQPSFSKANHHTRESGIADGPPPGGLSAIAIVLVAIGIENLIFGLPDPMLFIGLVDFVGIAFALVRSGTGLLMLVSGWGLARWKKWGFYGAIVSNGILLAYILIGAAFSLVYCSIHPVWTVAGIAMILIIIHYLLRPDIRTRFQ